MYRTLSDLNLQTSNPGGFHSGNCQHCHVQKQKTEHGCVVNVPVEPTERIVVLHGVSSTETTIPVETEDTVPCLFNNSDCPSQCYHQFTVYVEEHTWKQISPGCTNKRQWKKSRNLTGQLSHSEGMRDVTVKTEVNVKQTNALKQTRVMNLLGMTTEIARAMKGKCFQRMMR